MSKRAAYELILRRAEEYRKASRQERTQILDGLERDTGYNRKTLIRLMRKTGELLELRDSLDPVLLMQRIRRARMTLYHLLQQKRSFTRDPASVVDTETNLRNARNISARKETQTENPSGDLNYETSNPEEA